MPRQNKNNAEETKSSGKKKLSKRVKPQGEGVNVGDSQPNVVTLQKPVESSPPSRQVLLRDSPSIALTSDVSTPSVRSNKKKRSREDNHSSNFPDMNSDDEPMDQDCEESEHESENEYEPQVPFYEEGVEQRRRRWKRQRGGKFGWSSTSMDPAVVIASWIDHFGDLSEQIPSWLALAGGDEDRMRALFQLRLFSRGCTMEVLEALPAWSNDTMEDQLIGNSYQTMDSVITRALRQQADRMSSNSSARADLNPTVATTTVAVNTSIPVLGRNPTHASVKTFAEELQRLLGSHVAVRLDQCLSSQNLRDLSTAFAARKDFITNYRRDWFTAWSLADLIRALHKAYPSPAASASANSASDALSKVEIDFGVNPSRDLASIFASNVNYVLLDTVCDEQINEKQTANQLMARIYAASNFDDRILNGRLYTYLKGRVPPINTVEELLVEISIFIGNASDKVNEALALLPPTVGQFLRDNYGPNRTRGG